MPALSQRHSASPNLVLTIVCAGVVLASLDLFIVNVALPQMARSFGARAASSSVVSCTYLQAVVTPTANPAASSANVSPLRR